MPKKAGEETREKIIFAAWKLFYENGFEKTTVDDIVADAGTSKGSFYHFFGGKDEIINTLPVIFDDLYEKLRLNLTDVPKMNAIDKLLLMTNELFIMIDNNIPPDLMAKVFSNQLNDKTARTFADRSRPYYKLLRSIVTEGMAKGELRDDMSVNEISNSHAMFERALVYDWCLADGNYSLAKYAKQIIPFLYSSFVRA